MIDVVAGLIGKKFRVLDQGWVSLAGVMGTDQTIVDRARGTTGTESRKKSADRDLIRMMMRHHHGSSFEFPEVDLHICTTFVVWRQMIRHRAGNILDEMTMWDEPSVNELSGRYSELPEMVQVTDPDRWRAQSKSNRQGSGDYVSPAEGIDFTRFEAQATGAAMDAYHRMIDAGVAKEQARKVFPMGGYTVGFMKMDLRNWLHWSALRLAPDAQQEIRDYAQVITKEILKPLFPVTWEAFDHYVLKSITLSALDVLAASLIVAGGEPTLILESTFTNTREQSECRAKLARIGLLGREMPSDG